MTSRNNASRVIFDFEAISYDSRGLPVSGFTVMRQPASPPTPPKKAAPVVATFFPVNTAMYEMVARMA